MDEEINSFEIYFDDLKPEIQSSLLKFMKITKPEEGNYDIFPIVTLENIE